MIFKRILSDYFSSEGVADGHLLGRKGVNFKIIGQTLRAVKQQLGIFVDY